jgi:hypothetical protein
LYYILLARDKTKTTSNVVWRNTEARSLNHCCRGKAISIKYYKCASVFLSSLLSIILPFVTCLALPQFFTLSHKRDDFRERVSGHKICVLIFSATFVWNISHFKNNSARYHKCNKRDYALINGTSNSVHESAVTVQKQQILDIPFVRARAYACECVNLLIQQATRMRHIVICNLWLHHIFRHYLITGAI